MSENPEMQKEIARAGVDFSKCQMNEIVAADRQGKQVEFESFSPYLADYNLKTGEIWPDKLMNHDQIGLAVAKAVRQELPRARMISLYDEYNTGMPDTADYYGLPYKEGENTKSLVLAPEVKANFKKSIVNLWQQEGLIGPNDKEDKNYLLVSESEKTEGAPELLRRLVEGIDQGKAKGKIIYGQVSEGKVAQNEMERHNLEKRKEELKEQITFITEDGREIRLRDQSGHWTCQTLDASSYLDPKNLEITHLVILPNEFKEQQDKVWEILRSLDIQPTNYHNIFFDKDLPPEAVAEVIREEIEKAKLVK